MADHLSLVSIICPVYNSEKYLVTAIESVIAQSFDNWELIVVDDGSGDSTGEIVRRYAQRDSRIRLVELGENRGVAHARNVGLQCAAGEWVAFLDSDDYWLPEKLERTLLIAQAEGAAFLFSSYRAISHDGNRVSKQVRVPEKLGYRTLLRANVIATSTVLVNREAVGEIKMMKNRSEDFICWLEILKRVQTARGLQEDLVRYRLTKSSLSRDKRKALGIVWSIYRDIENLGFAQSCFTIVQYLVLGALKHFSIVRTLEPM